MRIARLLLLAPIAMLVIGCGGGKLFDGSFFGGGGGGGGGGNPASIYVSNDLGNSVTIYPVSSNGNVSPSRELVGCTCHLDHPAQAFVDGSGNLYVVNQGTPGTIAPSIDVFAPGSNGNVAPARKIFYGGFSSPQALTVDGSGNIFVGDTNGSIFEFSSSANGPATPIATISGASTKLQTPMALAEAGGQLYVADHGAQEVLIFASGANGNVAPTAEIGGAATGLAAGPSGVAVNAAGNVFVTTFDTGHILEFATGASGNASPIKDITGASTGLSNTKGIGLDSTGNMYVSRNGANQVLMFAASLNGNVAPTATIGGTNTQLDGPFFVTI